MSAIAAIDGVAHVAVGAESVSGQVVRVVYLQTVQRDRKETTVSLTALAALELAMELIDYAKLCEFDPELDEDPDRGHINPR
ncbi:hypothetical protein [Lacisediminihabitans profunda]|uniref:Uncharacterized protein n=1 Tax=Lacisediminihabitans profunda TaxID=2594790 RepID=A0A5C8ULY0_9MICO|nr:hypothetical protein [Lacisediminihabitans profunda]TXN29323.1 hypothetical protein FVP33_14180 [Lacisediminihabitans profunda]